MPKDPTTDPLSDEPEDLLDALEAEDAGDMEGIDPNHPVLSVADQRAAKEEARAAVLAEQRKAALKAFVDKEKQRLKTEEGLVTGDRTMDEIVEVLLDLPPFADRLAVNGQPFFHAHPYKLPRHVANSLREQQARAWQHQQEIEGHGLSDRFRNEAIRGMRPANVLSGKAA